MDPTGTADKINELIDDVIEKDPTGIIGRFGGEAIQIGISVLRGEPVTATDVLIEIVQDELYRRVKKKRNKWPTGESPQSRPNYVKKNANPKEYTQQAFNQGSFIPPAYDPYRNFHPSVARLGHYMDQQIDLMRQYQYMRYLMQMQVQMAMQQQIAFMMIPKWYWYTIPNSNYVNVICPFYAHPHGPVHFPMVIPYPVFNQTRGKWSQCAYCGNWSFTP